MKMFIVKFLCEATLPMGDTPSYGFTDLGL